MFYIQQDEKIVLFDEDKQKLQDTIAFMPQYEGLEIKETQDSYVIYDFELMTVEEKEAKEKQKERERLDMLFLTGADVERGIYQAKGMDFDDIIALVEHLSKGELDLETGEIINKSVDIDVKALKIELKANNFYRGNPYVNAVGSLLGFTTEQLDRFFETKDYKELINENTTDTDKSDVQDEMDATTSEQNETDTDILE